MLIAEFQVRITPDRVPISSSDCPEGERACRSGHCLPLSNFCDRTVQCPDGDDEEKCSREFFLSTFLFLPYFFLRHFFSFAVNCRVLLRCYMLNMSLIRNGVCFARSSFGLRPGERGIDPPLICSISTSNCRLYACFLSAQATYRSLSPLEAADHASASVVTLCKPRTSLCLHLASSCINSRLLFPPST